MAPHPLLLCSLLAATALAAREWTSGEESLARAGDAVFRNLWGLRHGSFGYESHNGPTQWPSMFPECGGRAQSPVDIRLKTVSHLKCPSPLRVPDLEWDESQLRIINNGHTVMLEPVNPSSVKHLTLSGGPLAGEYQLAQMHFHWGDSNAQGSEHAIDGFYGAMELHMVFARKLTRHHARFDRAHDDLVVIGVFLQEVAVENPSLAAVVAQLEKVVEVNAEVLLQCRFGTAGLVPPVSSGVLVYNGSLTTPPCSEVVTWLVFRRPVVVSARQVAQFRKLKSPDGLMTRNRRPVQPLNGRQVYWACAEPGTRGRSGQLPSHGHGLWVACWPPLLAWALHS